MKKTVWFILMMFVSLKAFASQENAFYFDFDLKCVGKMPRIFCEDKNYKGITGTVGLSYNNNKSYGEYYFENGWIHGNIKYFEPLSDTDTTEAEVTVNMIHGKRQGLQTAYLKDTGEILSEINFDHNEENGMAKFYKNGIVALLTNFKDGKYHGTTKYYDKYGNITLEANFKNGEKDGVTKFYDENGKISGEYNYEKGKQNGITVLYFEDGGKVEINYKNGIQNGSEKSYDKAGNLVDEKIWNDGIRVK